MRPVSARLANIVQSSHTAKARIKLVSGFPQSTTPTGTTLTVVSGDVKMDSSATVRATLDCEVLAPWGSILPDGDELFVEYGVEVSGGQTEWVALGYFRVEDVTQGRLNGPTRIAASDRMAQVVDTEAVFPWVSPVGISHANFFTYLMFGEPPDTWFHPNAGVFPSSTVSKSILFDYDATTQIIPYQIPLDAPFHELMDRVAGTLDKRMFFDYLGRLNVVKAEVTPDAEAVATLRGGKDGTLRGVSRQISRGGVYNSVRVDGSQPTEGVPPTGYVVTPLVQTWDLSWYGKFGRILKNYSSPLLTTSTACTAAAETIYKKVKGLPYSMSLDCVPNPALEPLDVIAVTFPGAGPSSTPPMPGHRYDLTERHVIDSLTFPLAGGDMSITTRGTVVQP